MLFYRAALPLSRHTLTWVAGLIRVHRQQIGSVWRRLDCAQQALLVLVHLRKGETLAEVGAGFGVSATTCWRYVTETVKLLAAHAPKLWAALTTARRASMAFVVLDGTLIPIDRVAADRPYFSGKHRIHGMTCRSSPHLTARSCGCRVGCPAACMTPPRPGSGRCSRRCVTPD
jgi:hypothetical protein